MVEAMKSSPLAIPLLMLLSSSVFAESVLRIQCADNAEGAKVFINGELKGNCPTDLFLPPGDTALRVVKPVDDEQERIYKTEFSLADQSAKRVNVELSQPQLTAEAKQERERARQERERKAAERAMEEAEDGDTDAMRKLAGYYRDGKGIPEDSEKATEWLNTAKSLEAQRAAEKTRTKAADGDIEAMRQLAERYESGDGVEQSPEQAEEWISRAREAEAEARKARQQARQVAAEKARNEELQEYIDNTVYFETTNEFFDVVTNDPGGSPLLTGVSPVLTGFTVVEAAKAPTQSTQVARWRNQMSHRPAAFDNPDSMIARVYARQQSKAD